VRWLWLIFGLGVLTRLVGQLVLGAYAHPDVFEYEDIASNLIAGRGYTYASPDGGVYVASQSSPLYILLTAGVYLLTAHSQAAMLALQALLGGLTAVLIGWLGHRVFSKRAAVAAGILVAIDPALVVYASQLHSLTLDALANVSLVCASVALPQRPNTARMAGVGALFGLAALTRATALLLVALNLVWLRANRGVKLASIPAAAMVLLALLVYSPWPLHNSLLLGQLTLGSSETSEWLWRGNNPNANGGSLTQDGQRMLALAPPGFRAQIAAANEAQRIAIYQTAALDFVRANPSDAAALYLTKLKAFWWGTQQTGLLYPPDWLRGYQLWYLLIVPLAAAGVWGSRSEPAQWSTVLLILGTLVVVSVVQAAFYVEGRHRIAVEPLILLLSGVGLAALALRPGLLPSRPPAAVRSPRSSAE
jgi:4-amino-4-deoxy-L-arabinose transferase-like glycosyltransferase